LFLLSCKKEANVPPEPDTETQQSIDVAWATFLISDIEQLAGFLGDNQLYDHFYINTSWSPDHDCPHCGTITVTNTGLQKTIAFNKTYCVDGKYREGTLFMNTDYNNEVWKYLARDRGINADPHARYYHDYGFCGLVTLTEYKIDGWRISTKNGEPAPLYCTLQTAQYDPRLVRLTWHFSGEFNFEHPSDPNRNMTWKGSFEKTLLNSTDKNVWGITKIGGNEPAISWSLGLVSYSGSATGLVAGNVPFMLEFGQPPVNPNEKPKPLIRDFTCSSDPVYETSRGVAPNYIKPEFSRHHPFVRGIMTFTPGVGTDRPQYRREIYFGDEVDYNNNHSLNDWDANTMSASISNLAGDKAPCDNTGVVYIKGMSYKVNFMK
jgi:hypothetical protein